MTVNNFVDSARGDANFFSQAVLTDIQWLKKFLYEDFSRVNEG